MEELSQKPVEINYSFEDAPTLYRFYNCDKRIIAVRGCRGSGKSSVCVQKLLKNGLNQAPDPRDGIRRSRWAIVRNTYAQLKDSSIRKVLEWLPEEHFGTFKITTHDYYITAFEDTEIEFSFRALDKPKDVRNLLSMELSGAWINEAREIPKVIFDNLDPALGRFPAKKDGGCTLPQLILDTNSPEEGSWWFNYFEKDKPENAEQFIQPSGRSPEAENVIWLPENYYENLIQGKDPDWIKVYIDNEYGFVREGELVYEHTYSDSLHTAKSKLYAVPGRPLIIGMDFGLTPCAVIVQVTPMGHFNVLEEYVSTSMGVQRFVRNILKPLIATKYHGYKIIITGDPTGRDRSAANEITCYNILHEEFPGFIIEPARTNSPVARVGAVEHFLTQLCDLGVPSLQLNAEECETIRNGFGKGYIKDKLGNPKKNFYSHIHDALQYAALYIQEQIKRMANVRPTRRRPPYEPPTHVGL